VNIAQEILITDLDERKQRLIVEWPGWITSSLRQPFISGIVDSSRLVMRVLYTFCCNIPTHCNQPDSNLV